MAVRVARAKLSSRIEAFPTLPPRAAEPIHVGQILKRLATKFEYHDSSLMEVTWLPDGDLQLLFELDGHWNDGSSHTQPIIFGGVTNRHEIETTLESFRTEKSHVGCLADVVALVREANGLFLLDTSQGALRIQAKSLLEL